MYLIFDTAEERGALLSHGVSPLPILLHKFTTRFRGIAASFHFEFIREAKPRIKHVQSFFYKLKFTPGEIELQSEPVER